MTYCANCETEAIRMIVHEDGECTPLCFCCSTAYSWGQTDPEARIEHLKVVDFTVRDDGTYVRVRGGDR